MSRYKKIISLAVSLSILALIYWKIDLNELLLLLRSCHKGWLGLSLLMFIPIFTITAKRLQMLVPTSFDIGLKEALRLVLAGSALNMVLPSKMGDIAKAYFISKRGIQASLALALVLYEKTCDTLALLLWCALGLTVYADKGVILWALSLLVFLGLALGILMLGSRKFSGFFFAVGRRLTSLRIAEKISRLEASWNQMRIYVAGNAKVLVSIAGVSIFIWFIHLLQIWFFVLTLQAWVPLRSHLALCPLAIFAGLLPLTFAGVGTRDAALIFFYQGFLEPFVAAALGLLCTGRYLIPTICGLPFLSGYLSKIPSTHPQHRPTCCGEDQTKAK